MNGYTQLNIGGTVRGFKWGKRAFETYMRMLKLKPEENVSDLTNKLNTDHSVIILYAGLSMNCFAKRVDEDFSFEDCVEWDESLPAEEQAKINEAVESSTWFGVFRENLKKKEDELSQQKSGGRKGRKK